MQDPGRASPRQAAAAMERVRFKRFDDLDRAAVRDLLLEAARTGFGV